jgi:hypothetical protein
MIDWVSLITAIGGVGVAFGAKELIQGWINKRNGKADEEKRIVHEALDDAEKLRNKLEHQYSINRIIKEYASQLRRLLIDKGIPVSDIPDWPKER